MHAAIRHAGNQCARGERRESKVTVGNGQHQGGYICVCVYVWVYVFVSSILGLSWKWSTPRWVHMCVCVCMGVCICVEHLRSQLEMVNTKVGTYVCVCMYGCMYLCRAS